jgi:N-acyl-D-aspartate/D-glutamate deacylase
VNVIDFENLALTPPVMVHDLPAGGKRLLQGARGYLHTIVSGTETYADGQATGELPGQFVRGERSDPGLVGSS